MISYSIKNTNTLVIAEIRVKTNTYLETNTNEDKLKQVVLDSAMTTHNNQKYYRDQKRAEIMNKKINKYIYSK